MSTVLAGLVVFILIVSVIIILGGSSLAVLFPLYNKLNKEENKLSTIIFSQNLVRPEGEEIYTLCDKKLSKTYLKEPSNTQEIRNYIDKYTISSVLHIVSYYRNGRLKKLLKSLRMPAFIIIILFLASLIKIQDDENNPNVIQIVEIWQGTGLGLLKLLSFGELCTFMIISIRIYIELYFLNDFFDVKE